ncbi:MAG TPA: phosphoribosyltransferase family protein [Dehalococcoidia bacterium]|nr:phosphoribosyltransferase family protein [Dehalococcoidia bacterium]
MNDVWDKSARQFNDRTDAGVYLAEALEPYRGRRPLILGIPRGGVPVAAEVARRLGAELDVVVARKLGAPGSPELAIGAVTANGGRYLNDSLIREIGVRAPYIEEVTALQRAEAARREERFRAGRPPPSIEGRVVIVVDDGLATGATMRAAVRSVRRSNPALLVAAVPVGAPQSCAALRTEVDELICLHEPEDFWAVGFYYRHFRPTEDEEVSELLRVAHGERSTMPQQAAAAPAEATRGPA